jgi:uncharacterized DUF497 family protein
MGWGGLQTKGVSRNTVPDSRQACNEQRIPLFGRILIIFNIFRGWIRRIVSLRGYRQREKAKYNCVDK